MLQGANVVKRKMQDLLVSQRTTNRQKHGPSLGPESAHYHAISGRYRCVSISHT
jgi:hypothetical protein